MTVRRGYLGIDRFRIVAALLVVAVHTSPLLSLGALPDFLFTRVLARLGVPFFFAATGFFLLAPYAQNRRAAAAPIRRFEKKTALLYGACVLLYLPVNLYAGHFRAVARVGQALQLLLVDGTMYHLWYLPAAMLGVALVWGLLRLFGLPAATVAAAALYVVGLLGDSYFGVAGAAPALGRFYDGIFAFCGYTRNGLFYAPIFLLMGVWAARRQGMARPVAVLGFGLGVVCLLAEGMALFAYGNQRHDSMYVLLPVCTFFLLVWLASFRGPGSKALRNVSLLVYVLHPWVIVLLRGAAKQLGADALLVGNSVVHYLVVCAGSFAAACGLVWLKGRVAGRSSRRTPPRRAWVEVDLAALARNLRTLQSLVPGGCRLMPVVKADAYGLGAVPIAKALNRLGVRHFCVATVSEGVELRKHRVRGDILVLGYTHPDDWPRLKRHRLAQTVVDHAHGMALAQTGQRLRVHIKVDTGMHRLGEPGEQVDNLCALFAQSGLDVRGVFTQLACSDSPKAEDIARTKRQIARFSAVTAELETRGVPVPKRHIQCSYGILNHPDAGADFARPGLALYGVVDEACCIGPAPALEPVFAVKARVALVKPVRKGERVGYGNSFVAAADRKIAVITMGYADGLPRSVSGAGGVLLHGQKAPFVGSICMDQAIVDVSHIPCAAAGDTAVVIGGSGDAHISVLAFAQWAGTIPNEVMSRLGSRLARVYDGGR